jgi:thiol-disulfide isomerase/thioredoxin
MIMEHLKKTYQRICFFQICIVYAIFCIFLSCQSWDSNIPSDKARLSGKISDQIFTAQKDTPTVIRLLTPTHFTNGYQAEIVLNSDGTFVFDVPVVCPQLAQITSDIYKGIFCLIPGKETTFEITLDESGEIITNMINGTEFTKEDQLKSRKIFEDINSLNNTWQPLSPMGTDDFDKFVIFNLEKIAKTIEKNPEASCNAKKYEKQHVKLFYLNNFIFTSIFRYDRAVIEKPLFPAPVQMPYQYAFLKHFDLNNSTVVYPSSYMTTLRKILAQNILEIPTIGETPVKDWLKETKAILSGLIGSDTGLFYDLLAANAYTQQLEDLDPLSEKQMENIRQYFKNPSYIDLIFAENEKLIVEKATAKINQTPDVPKEKLIDAIVANYKGKAVVVDFWATWCGPCMEAMKQSEALKKEMQDKNVIFVYIANTSSPLEKWKIKANIIEGEHYYLTKEEWEYIADKLQFGPIPTYAFYAKNGELKNKITGFPGVEEMQKMIEELLP